MFQSAPCNSTAISTVEDDGQYENVEIICKETPDNNLSSDVLTDNEDNSSSLDNTDKSIRSLLQDNSQSGSELFLINNPYCKRQIENIGLIEKEVVIQRKGCVLFGLVMSILIILLTLQIYYYTSLVNIPTVKCLTDLKQLCQLSLVILAALLLMYMKIFITKIRVLRKYIKTITKDSELWTKKYQNKYGKGNYYKHLILSVKEKVKKIRQGPCKKVKTVSVTTSESSEEDTVSEKYGGCSYSDEEDNQIIINTCLSKHTSPTTSDTMTLRRKLNKTPARERLLDRMLISDDDYDDDDNDNYSINSFADLENSQLIDKVDHIIGESASYQPLHDAANKIGNKVRTYENYRNIIDNSRKAYAQLPNPYRNDSYTSPDIPYITKSGVEDLNVKNVIHNIKKAMIQTKPKVVHKWDKCCKTGSGNLKMRKQSIKCAIKRKMLMYQKLAMVGPILPIITIFIWIVMAANVKDTSLDGKQVVITDPICTSAYIFCWWCIGIVLFFNIIVLLGIMMAEVAIDKQEHCLNEKCIPYI